MILLSVKKVTKHFGVEPVLAGLSFDVRANERIGLVGPNGTGKTTLLKILVEFDEADSGSVELHASACIGYLDQKGLPVSDNTVWQEAESALSSLISVAQQAESAARAMASAVDDDERLRLERRYDDLQHEIEAHGAYELDHRVARVLQGLGFSTSQFQQLAGQLSGGQQARLMLSKLLLRQPDVMLLDEPSNHLDIEATEWLEKYLSESTRSMIIASHDRYFLDKTTDRTLELFQGTAESYSGSFSAYQRQKVDRLQTQRRTYERQQTEITKMEEFVRRNQYGQKHAQAEDRRKKIDRIERVPRPREISAPSMGFPTDKRCGDIVVRAEHLAKCFETSLFQDLSFDILRGQKWGILGPNGCGKTTLMRCILGDVSPDEGHVVVGKGVVMGYFDQKLAGIVEGESLIESIRPDQGQVVEREQRDLLARFGLVGDIVNQAVSSLSGGERNRAGLARLAAQKANFLLLDEPTNHLDLWARDALERSLNEFGGTVMLVSHDRYLLNRVTDHLIVVEDGRFRIVEGNYDTYLNLRSDKRRVGSSGSARGQHSAVSRNRKQKTVASRRNWVFPYRKAEEIEQEIAEREKNLEQLHGDLTTPAILRDGLRVKELKEMVQVQRQMLEQLYAHWEEAIERNA